MTTTTREADLAALESFRDEAQDTAHYQALLDSVWEQSKDQVLEKLRNELIYWVQKGIGDVPELGVPTMKQKMGMAESEINIQRIEKEIKAYTATPEYQAKLAVKVATSSRREADLLMLKQKKGFL